MRQKKFKFDVRTGDVWVLLTNTGGISREVTGVDDTNVYYRPYGSPYEQECKRATFRRWCRGAGLEYRLE